MAQRSVSEIRYSARPDRACRTRKGSKFGKSSFFEAGGKDRWSSASFHAQGILTYVKAIADTGFLVAFGNRGDTHHAWALDIARRVTEPLLTCEAVLAEAAFHLNSAALVLEFVRDGLARPALIANDHLPRLAELAARYADRDPDLADLCLIRLSELHPRHPVITTDMNDFRVYRRGRRETIPLIHPPAK
jgi:uncharacterized protein